MADTPTLGALLFVAIRKIIFPFSSIEKYVPRKGNILDVGCGHGIFSTLLVDKSKSRKVLAIDPSDAKIKSARLLAGKRDNLTFKTAYLVSLPQRAVYDCVVIVDVLCMLPKEEQIELLKQVKKRLAKKNGVLVLKEVERNSSIMYYIILFEEFLMRRVLRLTYTDNKETYLMTRSETRDILSEAGFSIKKIIKIRGLLPYPHILFIGAPNGST